MSKSLEVIVITPVFNDNFAALKTIQLILESTKNKVIVVDDGSTDNTFQILKKHFSKNPRVILLHHSINCGKGAAMRTGVEHAISLKIDAVIFIDSDGQHDPKLISSFEKELRGNDLVFGFRKINSSMPLFRRLFNYLFQILARFFFGISKRDLFCGYLGMSCKLYRKIKWQSNRYGVEAEMVTKVGKQKLSFKEVLIETVYLNK